MFSSLWVSQTESTIPRRSLSETTLSCLWSYSSYSVLVIKVSATECCRKWIGNILQAYLGAKILTKEDIVGKRQDMGAISVGRLSKWFFALGLFPSIECIWICLKKFKINPICLSPHQKKVNFVKAFKDLGLKVFRRGIPHFGKQGKVCVVDLFLVCFFSLKICKPLPFYRT